MKFSTKLSLLALGTILVSDAFVSYFGYTSNARSLEKNVINRLEEQAFHVMDELDRMFFERYMDMRMFATDNIISSRASTPEQVRERLTAFLNINKFYISISIFDLNRIRIADTSGMYIGTQHPFAEYWPDIAAGKDFVVNMSESQSLKKIALHFAFIVKDNKGAPFAVVVARIPVEKLTEISSQAAGVRNDEELRVSLVDKNGLLIYSNYLTGILKDISPDWAAVKDSLAAGAKMGSGRHYFSEGDELSTFAREKGYLDYKGNDWTLIICTYARSAFAPAREMAKRMGLILFTIGIFVLLIVIVFSRALSRPIEKLSAAAIEIGQGNLDVKIDVASHDEIGQLARAFNKMAIDLKEDITQRQRAEKEIHALNEALELKVQDRTRQLLDAQEELVRKEKLSMLGQLSGSIGHELRNPLGVINNAVYFLKTVLPGADETVMEYLGIIKGEVDNSLRIISDLLDFSRAKTPQVETIAVSELVRKNLARCHNPADVSVQVDIPATLPPLRIDPLQMGQVLQNLFLNATQAMPHGGTLRITARLTKDEGGETGEGESTVIPASAATAHAAAIEISVIDTGEGISAMNLKKLFHPLFTTKARGIGLGLVVSKNIVEANGGRIEVDSQVGNGSTFRVILPVKDDRK